MAGKCSNRFLKKIGFSSGAGCSREFRFEPPWWLHVMLWVPLTFGVAVWMLRVLKAWLIAQQFIHRSTALED